MSEILSSIAASKAPLQGVRGCQNHAFSVRIGHLAGIKPDFSVKIAQKLGGIFGA